MARIVDFETGEEIRDMVAHAEAVSWRRLLKRIENFDVHVGTETPDDRELDEEKTWDRLLARIERVKMLEDGDGSH